MWSASYVLDPVQMANLCQICPGLVSDSIPCVIHPTCLDCAMHSVHLSDMSPVKLTFLRAQWWTGDIFEAFDIFAKFVRAYLVTLGV